MKTKETLTELNEHPNSDNMTLTEFNDYMDNTDNKGRFQSRGVS